MPAEELGLRGDGVEKKSIKALDDAMSELISNREKRQKFGKLEKEAGAVVVDLFKKHKLRSYNYDERSYDLKAVEKVILHKDDSEDDE